MYGLIRSFRPGLEAILADQRAYLTAEGPARRGPRFEQLAFKLSTQIHVHGKRVGRPELFAILGDPDLESGVKVDPSLGSVRAYAYFYDRFGRRDWAVYAMVDDAGHVSHLGFNNASATDHSSWRPFTSTTTRAAVVAP